MTLGLLITHIHVLIASRHFQFALMLQAASGSTSFIKRIPHLNNEKLWRASDSSRRPPRRALEHKGRRTGPYVTVATAVGGQAPRTHEGVALLEGIVSKGSEKKRVVVLLVNWHTI